MTVNAAQVRALGNLSSRITDAVISPHLSRAVRDVEERSGVLQTAWGSHARSADLEEAAGCLALGYAAPVLNTMYLADADRLARKVGELSDFVFSGPNDWIKLVQYWNDRAASALARVSDTVSAPGELDAEAI